MDTSWQNLIWTKLYQLWYLLACLGSEFLIFSSAYFKLNIKSEKWNRNEMTTSSYQIICITNLYFSNQFPLIWKLPIYGLLPHTIHVRCNLIQSAFDLKISIYIVKGFLVLNFTIRNLSYILTELDKNLVLTRKRFYNWKSKRGKKN